VFTVRPVCSASLSGIRKSFNQTLKISKSKHSVGFEGYNISSRAHRCWPRVPQQSFEGSESSSSVFIYLFLYISKTPQRLSNFHQLHPAIYVIDTLFFRNTRLLCGGSPFCPQKGVLSLRRNFTLRHLFFSKKKKDAAPILLKTNILSRSQRKLMASGIEDSCHNWSYRRGHGVLVGFLASNFSHD
jgi:hypothetical protein